LTVKEYTTQDWRHRFLIFVQHVILSPSEVHSPFEEQLFSLETTVQLSLRQSKTLSATSLIGTKSARVRAPHSPIDPLWRGREKGRRFLETAGVVYLSSRKVDHDPRYLALLVSRVAVAAIILSFKRNGPWLSSLERNPRTLLDDRRSENSLSLCTYIQLSAIALQFIEQSHYVLVDEAL